MRSKNNLIVLDQFSFPVEESVRAAGEHYAEVDDAIDRAAHVRNLLGLCREFV
jgi:hypothetical protein